MNVSNNPSIQRLARILETQAAQRQVRTSPSTGKAKAKDSVDLSGEARLLAAIQSHLSEGAEVRWDKVEALKEAIEKGTYRPSAEDIAQSIIDEGKIT